MHILAFDTSAKAASCAVWEDNRLGGEYFVNCGLTHSQTILPMAEALLRCTQVPLEKIEALAVSVGPGSFTGLRIGISAVKALAYARKLPVCPVSTLEGLAWNLMGMDGIFCAVMDARCGQVYTACFQWGTEGMIRLTEDEALELSVLREQLSACQKPVWLVGDGAELCFQEFADSNIHLAPPAQRFQKASSVAQAAMARPKQKWVTAEELAPSYLRLPQAERELLKRQQAEEKLSEKGVYA